MKSIKFPGCNIEIGKGQEDQYHVIHAKSLPGPQCQVIACYELSDAEIEVLKKTKKIWYSRLRFGTLKDVDGVLGFIPQPFQPMLISVEMPIEAAGRG